jgi:hypothetical protein
MAIPAPSVTDEDIQQQVVNELKWDAEVEAPHSTAMPDSLKDRIATANRPGPRRGIAQPPSCSPS